MMNNEIQLLDVVALTMDLPQYNLFRGEIGAVVECYANDGYEVEFVSLDGYTYALVALRGNQLIHSDRNCNAWQKLRCRP